MATTPELHQPQIAAARAQAWHQNWQQVPTQTTSAVESQPEAQSESQPTSETEDQLNLAAEDQPEAESGNTSETESEEVPETASNAEAGVVAEGISSVPAASTGSRILTLEAARDFVNSCGIVLFGPRTLGAPAPSLVEATLGAQRTSVTAAESETARSLVARLVAEGSAVPLNLLGGPGDVPDFLVSTAAFPFVFTLRGDKGWKRAPETSGAVKVTTLALHVYEVLTEKGALTVAEIVNEVGREITESAVTRSLSELWALLRVIPSLQQGEGATRWELTTARFVKAVKAGANAGQPTALSALISLYLGQAFLATEDEICAFLSPLTARSRVRDVLHGLSAGRQLSEAVLEGKTVLFLPDSLPDFAAADQAANAREAQSGDSAEGATPGEAQPAERIRRFEGGAQPGRDRSFRGKPVARPDSRFGGGAGRGPRPSRPAARGEDHPSRPFSDRGDRSERPASGAPSRDAATDRPSFSRPWDEEKRDRPARPDGDRPARPAFGARPSFGARDSRPPRREGGSDRPSFGNRPRPSFGGGDRPSFGSRERPSFGDRASSGSRPSLGDRPRPSFGDRDRPAPRRDGPAGAPPFRRRQEGGGDTRPFRSSFSPNGAGDGAPREPRGEGRPPRREGAAGGFFPRRDDREGSSDRPRPSGSRPAGDRPFRPAGDRPFRPAGDRPAGSFGPRKSFDRPSREGGPGAGRFSGGGGFRPRGEGTGGSPRSNDRPPFRENSDGGRPFNDRPARPFGDRPARPAGDRPSRPFGARPFNDRPSRDGEAPRSRPSGGFGDRGGFKRTPGGFNRGPGGSGRGPGGGGFSRGPARGSQGDRPAPRPRPEDEA